MKAIWMIFEVALFALGIAFIFDLNWIQWLGLAFAIRGVLVTIEIVRFE